MDLFGMELTGELPDDAVPTAIVLVVEYLNPDDDRSRRYLRLMATEMPLWARVGMLRVVVASDEHEATMAFDADED